MHIDRFLSKNRILDLKSRDMAAALDELLAVALPAGTPPQQRAQLLDALVEREVQMHRRVGGWAALPNIRTALVQSTVVAVGRLPVPAEKKAPTAAAASVPSTASVPASAKSENSPEATVPAAQSAAATPSAATSSSDVPATQSAPEAVPATSVPAKSSSPMFDLRVIFLVLAPENGRNYHIVLTELFTALESVPNSTVADAPDLASFRRGIMQIFKGMLKTAIRADSRWNRRFARMATRLAEDTRCRVLMFFADTFSRPLQLDDPKKTSFRIVVVSGTKNDYTFVSGAKPDVINVSSFATHRMSQLRAALFIGLMRGIIEPSDRVCCLGGNDGSDKLDSLIIVELAQEFPTMMTRRTSNLVPAKVRPEVLERAIGIATDLAVEGREGKPVGTIIVVGDLDKIKPYIEQLVMNPFSGYKIEDRNLLNPFVEETVKEWALIDGAFVVDGNGMIYSAGSRLTAVESQKPLPSFPSGLGTRHAAAAAISSVADCAAVCASSSGQVTLFRHGEAITLLERSVSRVF